MSDKDKGTISRIPVGLALAAGANPKVVSDKGDWFYIANSNMPNVTVSRDGQSPFVYGERQVVKGSFDMLQVYAPKSGTLSAFLWYGRGEAPNLLSRFDAPYSMNDIADVVIAAGAAATLGGASNAAVALHICCIAGGAIRVGSTTVGAARGFYLPQNVPWRFPTPQGVTIYNPNAGAVTVTCSEEWTN